MSQVKFLSYLVSKNLSPDEYAALYCITKKISIGPGYSVNYDSLYNEGFLSRKDSEWIPTNKTKNTIKFVESLFINDKNEKAHDEDTLNDLINKLQEVYPKKNPEGRSIRSNTKDVKNRLFKFLTAHDYSTDVILEAVTRYLKEQLNSADNGKYLRELRYFIMKGTESKLADYCQDVIENPVINKSNVTDHRFNEL